MRPIMGTYEWTEQHSGKMNLREKLTITRACLYARFGVRQFLERNPLNRPEFQFG